jgi:hypothetical protein
MKWLALLVLAACGSSPSAPSPYAGMCADGCATSRPDACLNQNTANCQSDCENEVAGMPANCAACLAAHITWRTSLCDPMTGQCPSDVPTCTGWSIARPTGTACSSSCR